MSDDITEIIPGDYVVALSVMRAWISDDVRGTSDVHIQDGEQALVLEVWKKGNKVRLRVLRDNRVLVFSCAEHVVHRNWKVARPAPRLPTFGCP